MNKLKKTLSVFLTLVMLFTTLCFFVLPETALSANAAVSRVDNAIIVVPETVYMTPSTGESKTGQYYVNNTIDTSYNVTLEQNRANTNGYVQFYIPNAKDVTIAVNTITSGIGDIVLADAGATSGSKENTSFATSIGGNGYFEFNTAGLYISGTGITAGNTALAEWIFTVTLKDGSVKTYYAYSTLYAPFVSPVGAAAEAWSGQGISSAQKAWAGSILWVSGVHGYSACGYRYNRGKAWYPRTDSFIPMLGIITEQNNTRPSGQWLTETANSLGNTVSYEEGDGSNHRRVNVVSPLAKLTVDTSRYKNFNQIPNFSVGYIITDSENADSGKWYVADYTGYTANIENNTDGGGTKSNYGSSIYDAACGTKLAQGSDKNCGIKYNGTWNKDITTGTVQLKSAYDSEETGGTVDRSAWNYNFVQVNVTGTDKDALRDAVMQATSINANKYTSASWNEYLTELRKAAQNLGNPTSTTVDTSALTAKRDALQTTVTLNANGGSLATTSALHTIGINATADLNVSSYVPTRDGYDFVGWAKDANAETGSKTTVNVGFGETIYAVWTLKSYKVMFDNLIEFSDWNTSSAGNGVISDVRDGGFTLTSNAGVGEATSSSPYFPVTPGEKYKIDIEFEGNNWDVYIFFCDANGNWIDFADGPTNRYSANAGTGIPADNAVFTAPNKASVVKAQIRVDANGSNNTVSFRHIRVTKEGTSAGYAPYTPSQPVTYTQAYGTLPTPVKAGYNFLGWYDINGNKIDATSIHNITSDIILYSKWSAKQYELTWVDGFGKTIKTETIDCGAAIVPPAENPTITAYTFAGWESYPAKMPAENLTIKATWTPVNYTITYDANGGTLSGNATQTYTIKSAIELLAAPVRTGYTFAGWEVTGTGHNWASAYVAGAALTERYGNVTLKAKWTAVDYTITYELDGGALAGNPPYGYKITDTITLPSNPSKTGYNFVGWDVKAGEHSWGSYYEGGAKISNAYGNVTLVAKWTPKTYKVTWVDWDGTVLETDEAVEYNTMPEYNGAQPSREDTVQNTYEFKGWTPEISVVTGNVTYTAEYSSTEKTFTVKFNYTTADGEKQILVENVKYNAAVTSIIPAEYKLGYLASADGFTHSHYVPSMNLGDAQNVTSDMEFTATYTLVSGVVLFEEGEGHKDPTCEEEGLDSRICSICQYAHSEVTNPTGHDHNDGVVTKEPTCLDDGEITYTCHCGHIYKEKKDKLGHSFLHLDAKDAKCNAQGWTEHLYCENCKLCYAVGAGAEAPYESAIDPYITSPDHDPDEANPANCYRPQYCLNCGEIVTEQRTHIFVSECVFAEGSDISCTKEDTYKIITTCQHEDCTYSSEQTITGTLPHEHEFVETVDPTCTEDGYDLYRCKNCGDEKQENIVGKLGHTEGEWVTVKPSTCTVPGDSELHCGRCNEVIATGKLDLAPHTCEWVTEEPDCTNQGIREYTCTVCGYVDMSEIISSLGHKSSGLATCDEPSICTVCNEVLQPALGHSWDNGVVTKEPTETETGMREYTCYRDETHKRYEDIPIRVVIELPEIPEDGTIDFDADEDGYIGNIGELVKVEEGIPYTTIVDNAGIVQINPNGDIYAAGDGNVLITVITNDGKYHKSFTATVRTVKTIIFDVNGSLTELKAYIGDSFNAIDVDSYRDENGFLKTFSCWTMNGAAVTEFICTGDMYLVAQFSASCDYDEFDEIAAKFEDVISGNYDNAGLLEANAAAVERAKALIAQFTTDRDTRTAEDQHLIDAAVKQISNSIVRIYPVDGTSIVIRGNKECTAGSYVEVAAYLMPIDVAFDDGVWTTTDRRVGFYSEGKFFAVKPGTVTLKVSRGTQTAEITIDVKNTVGGRVIFFDSMLYGAQYILEGAYIVTETTNLFWSPYTDIHFRVVTDHSYEEYSVFVNDVKVTPSADGTYTIPANTGDAHIRMVGLTSEDIENGNDGSGSTSKLSIWDLIREFFRKIGEFFKSLFGG